MAVGDDEQVFRLEVAVDDAAVMGGGQPARDLRAELDRLAGRHRPVAETLAQRFALEQLHDERAVFQAVDLRDVEVVERRQRLRLAFKARPPVSVGREAGRHDLDSDVAAQPRVGGPVHFSHAAGADGRHDLVGTNRGSGGKAHGREALDWMMPKSYRRMRSSSDRMCARRSARSESTRGSFRNCTSGAIVSSVCAVACRNPSIVANAAGSSRNAMNCRTADNARPDDPSRSRAARASAVALQAAELLEARRCLHDLLEPRRLSTMCSRTSCSCEVSGRHSPPPIHTQPAPLRNRDPAPFMRPSARFGNAAATLRLHRRLVVAEARVAELAEQRNLRIGEHLRRERSEDPQPAARRSPIIG